MGKFVGVCVGLFVLAVGFVVLTQGSEVSALTSAFRSQLLLQKIAWAVIVLVPMVMLPFAVWLWDTVVRQRQAAKALELRLDGARQSAKELAAEQDEAEKDIQHLTLTDPDDAIVALKRRVTEAERFADVQRRRNEDRGLEVRIDDVRAQQQGLKERLTPVLETRRSMEQIFLELDSQQSDIERALAEIASGDDAVALDFRLKNLTDFVRRSHVRCDQIEYASKTLSGLKETCVDLTARLVPFAAAEDGISGRLAEVNERTEKLAADLELLERTPEGLLADRVQRLAGTKMKLGDDISRLNDEFSKLAGLRRDIDGLFTAFDRALNTISLSRTDDSVASVENRIDELVHFIDQTQGQFDDIDRRVVVFGQLKSRLLELQSRLVPLESDDSGVVRLVDDLQDIRDRLIAKIRRIEGGEEGDLAARVKIYAESKRELEERVSSLADQFAKLASIRSDITGLFAKLSNAVTTSAD